MVIDNIEIELENELKIPVILPVEEGVDRLIPVLVKLKKSYDN